ncbi:MAG TPA: hypothetical protein V6D21_22930 [Candidatus Obscuribacterales bacterium]
MISIAYELGSKTEAAQLLGLKNPDSVKHYHRKWDDGIHYKKRPGGNRSGYSYNLTLIKHWQLCHENVNDANHLQEIAVYRRSLNPRK